MATVFFFSNGAKPNWFFFLQKVGGVTGFAQSFDLDPVTETRSDREQQLKFKKKKAEIDEQVDRIRVQGQSRSSQFKSIIKESESWNRKKNDRKRKERTALPIFINR